MASGTPGDGARDGPDVSEGAERATADEWRRLARQRSHELAELRGRRLVRAALAADRHTARAGGHARRWARRGRALGRAAALHASALGRSRPSEGQLAAEVGRLPAAAADPRRLLLVVVGGDAPADVPARVDVVHVDGRGDEVLEVQRALSCGTTELVGVLLGTTRPLGGAFWDRLTGAVVGEVACATPVLVHPHRPLARATPHDGAVRAAGLRLVLDADGVPGVVAAHAGDRVEPNGPVSPVDLAGTACVVFDRGALEEAGGLASGPDLAAALLGLGIRLRTSGGVTVVVPGAVAVDDRPVASRAELRAPIDPAGAAWRGVVERHGAALRRLVDATAPGPPTLTLTVAAPSAKIADRWGDWHLAESLADALRRAGCGVITQTADHADDLAGRLSDVHVVVRGLRRVRRTAGQRHVLWIISHPETVDDDELAEADLVLVASARFADHLRTRTTTPVDVLLQATDHRRFRPDPVGGSDPTGVVVVAKTRQVLRRAVRDALAAGIRPRIYGSGWEGLVDPDLVVSDYVPNAVLPDVYRSAAVVLNDHWRTMQAWGFVSNRVFDVLACGTPIISDPVEGMAALFDGAVLEYDDADDLGRLVSDVLADPSRARARADRGRIAVLGAHTFDHRALQLLQLLG